MWYLICSPSPVSLTAFFQWLMASFLAAQPWPAFQLPALPEWENTCNTQLLLKLSALTTLKLSLLQKHQHIPGVEVSMLWQALCHPVLPQWFFTLSSMFQIFPTLTQMLGFWVWKPAWLLTWEQIQGFKSAISSTQVSVHLGSSGHVSPSTTGTEGEQVSMHI